MDASISADEKLLEKYNKSWNESKSTHEALVSEMDLDFRLYLGDQWWDENGNDIAGKLRKEGRFPIVLNLTKKFVDTLAGSQRQTKTDLKCRPQEGSDQMVCDVYTRVLKWIREDQKTGYIESDSKDESFIGGVGWLYLRLDRSRDPESGDIEIKKISPFDILWDPRSVEKDLSDAQYLHYHKLIHRDRCINTWPEFEERFKLMSGRNESNGVYHDVTVNSDQGDYLKVVEYWYKESADVVLIMDVEKSAVVMTWSKEEAKKVREELKEREIDVKGMTDDDLKQLLLDENGNYEEYKKKKQIIKKAIVVEDTVVIEDRYYNDLEEWPFVPFWCYRETAYSKPEDSIQGMVRVLRDPQQEKNKRRSQYQAVVNTVPKSGFFAEQDSLVNENEYRRGAGYGKLLYFKRGASPPIQIPSPQLPAAFLQLEQSAEADMFHISLNPDLLGMINDPGAPGVSVRLRQKQGLAAFQKAFDNHNFATILMGMKIVKMVAKFYTTEKIKRILGEDGPFALKYRQIDAQIMQLEGQMRSNLAAVEATPGQAQEIQQNTAGIANGLMKLNREKQLIEEQEAKFWQKFREQKTSARYDIVMDEVSNSPTARMATQAYLKEMQQYGVNIPMEIWIEYSDMSYDIKEKFLTLEQRNREMQEKAVETQRIEAERKSVAEQRKMELEALQIQAKMEQDRRAHEKEMAEINLKTIKAEADLAEANL